MHVVGGVFMSSWIPEFDSCRDCSILLDAEVDGADRVPDVGLVVPGESVSPLLLSRFKKQLVDEHIT